MRDAEQGLRAHQPLHVAPDSIAFTILLGLFAALPALSIDLSAPTLPYLPQALGTTVTMAGLTLSLFMIGFAIGQFSAGSFSDQRGRRPVLLGALICFTVSGVGCAVAPSELALVLARLCQGFGAGACAVISFAMVQDLFEGEAARAKRSYVTAIFSAVPVLAPALGSVLVDWFGWRSVHVVLAFAGGLLFAVTWACVGESRSPDSKARYRSDSNRVSLWSDPIFLRATTANALSYGVIFAYIAGSPVVIVRQMGYPPTVFAAVFACTATALAIGAATSGLLGRRGTGAVAAIGVALIVTVAATLGLAGAGLARLSPATILVPLLLVVLFCRGILAPNLQHVAIDRWSERAGAASAVVGVSQLLAGALASIVVAVLLPHLNTNAVLLPMACLAVGALLLWRTPAR